MASTHLDGARHARSAAVHEELVTLHRDQLDKAPLLVLRILVHLQSDSIS